MTDCVKNLLKVKVTNVDCSPLTHTTSHLILEDTHFDQAWLALGISMLAVSSHFLVSCVLGNGFQENLHHNFPGHQDKADQSVVPQILSFPPWRWVLHLALFLSSGTSYSHQGLSKTRQSSLTGQWPSSQHPQLQPTWSHGLRYGLLT